MAVIKSTSDELVVVPALTSDQHDRLLQVAVDTIATSLVSGDRRLPDPQQFEERLRVVAATFVTLKRDDRLLGCIGTLEPYQPLVLDVAERALAAAFGDPRFPGITVEDFEAMSVEVSVLGPQSSLVVPSYRELADALRPGVDGLVVSAPAHRATFLPSVWESVRDAGDFCALLWRKAGLWPGDWPPGLRLSTYQVDAFEQRGPRTLPR